MIVYDEPDWEWGGTIRVRITREEAITRQKKAAALKGYTYPSDEDALQDFMTVHWAWEEE